jgi:hypothetical protein
MMTDPMLIRYEPREYHPSHPERYFELAPGNEQIPEEWSQGGWTHQLGKSLDAPSVELCSACGWTSYDQTGSYLPRIRIMHTRGNMGLWSLGSKWLVRDQQNDGALGNEYMTWKFLHEQPGHSIPLLTKMIRLTDPEDPIQFTVVSRAPGKELASIWHTLSSEQKSGYRDQLVDILKQLRQFTAPFPQKINGDKLDDSVLICTSMHPPTCFQIGYTEQEWLDNLSETLRAGLSAQNNDTKDEELIEKKLQEIKENFPSGAPYTLTHGDLNLTNIVVKDDKIQALVDWEQSGYYPWWVERYLSSAAGGQFMDDLFEGVWEKVHPDIPDDAFEVIVEKLAPVRLALKYAQVSHDQQRHGFWRAAFCKCKPFGGIIRPQFLGTPWVHVVDDWRNESVPREGEWGDEVKYAELMKKCDLNTPMPTPSVASARWFEKAGSPRQEK